MRYVKTIAAAALGAALAACSSSSSSGGGGGTPFPQPAGTVAVNFTVDDTVNKVWKSGELQWKGSMIYDTTTRKGTLDSTWGGPWAPLYDDGPWDQGGHEPLGSVAGDHKLGVTVFVTPPATGTDTYEYGLVDAASGGWLWVGGNGSFTVAAGATAAVNAAGLSFAAHGTTDMKLVIDTANLASGFTFTPGTTTLTVKGTGTAWAEVTLYDDGTHGDDTAHDGKYTMVLSQSINQAAPPYPGLLKAGDKPEFVFVVGGVEYKTSGICDTTGVTAFTKASGGSWTASPISIKSAPGTPSDGNSYITVGAGGTPFPQPAGTVAVNFTVDDTINKVWKSAELQWKGSMIYDPATRKGTLDSTWGGPWAPLYDDGPWDQGGHEPLGSVAGDHKLGITVFLTPPATGSDTYEYGLIDAASGGWLWVGSNGSYAVAAGATAPITAAGMAFAAHGTVDMRLVLDTHNLATGFTFTPGTTTLTVKGSATAWAEVTMYDDGTHGDVTAGDGKYTMVLSKSINQSAPPYPGLLKTGDKPEFVFVVGGVEYKTSGVCDTTGVTAETMPAAGAWAMQTISIKSAPGQPSDGNTYITVP